MMSNAPLREWAIELLSEILARVPGAAQPVNIIAGLAALAVERTAGAGTVNHQIASVQAMPPMRNEVSVPGIRNDRGKLPTVTGAAVGRVCGPNPGT